MKEHPVLFSGPMVRAILEGRKTQTRRVIKPEPTHFNYFKVPANGGDLRQWPITPHGDNIDCPYGSRGDRLWVKETWRVFGGREYEYQQHHPSVQYRANEFADFEQKVWRPSIFMPRWASRIILEITDVRCERLQDISEEDAIAEGCEPIGNENNLDRYRSGYMHLWNSINASRGFGWDTNPFVWCLTFRRVL